MIGVVVALAGSAGAVSRFVLDGHLRTRYDRHFPWATAIINISGSLLLGVIAGVLLKNTGMTSLEAIIGTGFCGGFTTFSTSSFEAVRLIERRDWKRAIGVIFGVLVLSLVAAAGGIALGYWCG